jgi:hypothetical protein
MALAEWNKRYVIDGVQGVEMACGRCEDELEGYNTPRDRTGVLVATTRMDLRDALQRLEEPLERH